MNSEKPKPECAPGNDGAHDVLRMNQLRLSRFRTLLAGYGLELKIIDQGPIPGSFWGDEEAGLLEKQLLVRTDTPVHSALHETGHFVCMDPARRAGLDTDAGGDYDEENAVCYLQILLAAHLPEMGSSRMMRDMDRWGYSFRLGSARDWFERDARDAQAWLISQGLINDREEVQFCLRGVEPAQAR